MCALDPPRCIAADARIGALATPVLEYLLTDNAAVPLIVLSPTREPVETINSVMRRAGEAVHCTWISATRDRGDALALAGERLLAVDEDRRRPGRDAALELLDADPELAPAAARLRGGRLRARGRDAGPVRLPIPRDLHLMADTARAATPCRDVTADEVDHLRAHGWVKLRGFVDPEVLGRVLEVAREQMGEDGDGHSHDEQDVAGGGIQGHAARVVGAARRLSLIHISEPTRPY